MADVAGSRSFRPFFYVMRNGVPIIRQEIEILHLDSRRREGISHGRYDPQCSDRFLVPGVATEDKGRFGRGTFARMTIIAVSVLAGCVATCAAQFVCMRCMGRFCIVRLLLSRRVTLETSWTVLPLLTGSISDTVAVEFRLFVAVHALHPFLVMDVRRSSIFTGILGIDSPSMAEGAGLTLVPFDEAMSFQQTGADAADHRPFHVTVAAGGMAASAGLFEDLLVKEFPFRRRKSLPHPMFLPRRCVMQGSRVGLGDILMAESTGFYVI